MQSKKMYEVWGTPGGILWTGDDEEECMLKVIHYKKTLPNSLIEAFDWSAGGLYPQRITRPA